MPKQDLPLPSVQTINDVDLKSNPRCSPSQYACLLAVLQKKQDRMSPKDLATFFSLFEVPNPGPDGDQLGMVQIANSVRKVLKGEARKQQSWGLAVQTFVNGEKSVNDKTGSSKAPAVAPRAAPAPPPEPEPEAVPEPAPEPVSEPEPVPAPAPEPLVEPAAEQEQIPQPEAEPEPEADPEPEPERPAPIPEPIVDSPAGTEEPQVENAPPDAVEEQVRASA